MFPNGRQDELRICFLDSAINDGKMQAFREPLWGFRIHADETAQEFRDGESGARE